MKEELKEPESLVWIANAKTEPEKFINNFMDSGYASEDDMMKLREKFRNGYCYYFATILKTAFNRGEICWTAPFGHFVWVDTDGKAYDIEGSYDMRNTETFYLIPEKYVKKFIGDFLHNGIKSKPATKADLIKSVKTYCKDSKEVYYEEIEDYFE